MNGREDAGWPSGRGYNQLPRYQLSHCRVRSGLAPDWVVCEVCDSGEGYYIIVLPPAVGCKWCLCDRRV